MAALPDLITVAQFRQMPEGGEYAYELHHGEVIPAARPKKGHLDRQHRLMMLLTPKLLAFVVRMECPYRPVAEFELRAADVAAVSKARWQAIDADDDLHGAPELVIEVRSPSNTQRHLQELAALCLARGAVEFWVVDLDKKSVTVMRREGAAIVYTLGSILSLAAFGAGDLGVDEIFAEA